ncbi:MAG: hypothetical protein KC589_04375 [Nanoarchaeota archaeon]|nr:hypothetical protein [Nanoarchaeota archaeon]
MKRISYKNDLEICFDKIKPFINICKITGKEELCNITIRYIPNEYILEIGSYREYFNKVFNEYIEDICSNVYDELNSLLQPLELEVIVYLEEGEGLTPWRVKKISKKI